MATITDRTTASRAAGMALPRLAAIQAQLGTRREAVSAGNFNATTLYSVFAGGVAMGGSTGTIVQVTVRNPGSSGARASVTAWRLRADSTGTLVLHRIIAGTVTVELLAVVG